VGSRPRGEETLVARAERGETTAYEELVRMHQGIAFRVTLAAAGDRRDAEEAAQDAFVKTIRVDGALDRADAVDVVRAMPASPSSEGQGGQAGGTPFGGLDP